MLIKKFLQTYLISIICSYTYLSCVLVVESCINRALETILRLYLQNYMAKENWELSAKFIRTGRISYQCLWCNFELQVCTQRSWKRPYGVGLLVAGLDESGAHLYYNCPSGNYFEYQAFAIGSRSQAAKTYLERRFDNFIGSSREDLIKDALIATRESLQGEKLRSSVCTIAVVGVGEPFHILDQETVQQLIDTFEIVKEEEPPAEEAQPTTEQEAPTDQASGADQGGAAAGDQGGSPMEIWLVKIYF